MPVNISATTASISELGNEVRPIFTAVYSIENFPNGSFDHGACIYSQRDDNMYVSTSNEYVRVEDSTIEIEIDPETACEAFREKLQSYKDPIKKQKYMKKLVRLKNELDNLIAWG